ncbi:MAG: prepilin peptidase [Lachnospiraceae bacterium]|nr:prepilin peptidase [Lachnospiraceae bacterium]
MAITEIIIPLSILSANALWDIFHREILPLPVMAMGAAGVLYRCCYLSSGIAGILTALIPGAFLLALSLVSEERIGKGDALLSLCLGEWLGFADCIFVIFLASAGAAAAAVLLWIAKKKDAEIPFVPFLLSGYILHLVILYTARV